MRHTYKARGLCGLLVAVASFLPPSLSLAYEPGDLPKPLGLRIIQSGHSLTDPIPERLIVMLRAMGEELPVVVRSTIPGSPMDWRWNNPATPDARATIGKYDLLVLTERTSLSNTMPFHNSEKQALQWFTHAWSKGNGGAGAETVLYATWVTLASGPDAENPYNDSENHIPWRERLPLELARWEQIMDYVNQNRPEGAPPMRMIPGPLLMLAMDDAIKQGKAPGLTDISDLFGDEIHINDVGTYLIALAHYAVIYGRDPRELPDRINNDPRPELAAFMQELVWQVVTDYERTGLSGMKTN